MQQNGDKEFNKGFTAGRLGCSPAWNPKLEGEELVAWLAGRRQGLKIGLKGLGCESIYSLDDSSRHGRSIEYRTE